MVLRVAVTGGGGQIAYSLLFRIASGEMFGHDHPIALHILEVPQGIEGLKGVVMELEDCGFPLLQEIKIGSDPLQVFEGVDHAILVGAKPRGPGMERKDLLMDNGKIFVEQGKALNKVASKDVLVFVVGNPCNTNCLIAMHNAPDINPHQFCAMTRLDQNRAKFQLAKKAGVPITEVDRMVIWGNHSATQVPDIVNCIISGKPIHEMITDKAWLQNDFMESVQKRGSAIIKARGKSSAASAANAILDGIHSYITKTKGTTYFSSALLSTGNPYGIKDDLIFSFPCQSDGYENIKIVPGLHWDDYLKEKIALTEKELIEERDQVSHLLTTRVE